MLSQNRHLSQSGIEYISLLCRTNLIVHMRAPTGVSLTNDTPDHINCNFLSKSAQRSKSFPCDLNVHVDYLMQDKAESTIYNIHSGVKVPVFTGTPAIDPWPVSGGRVNGRRSTALYPAPGSDRVDKFISLTTLTFQYIWDYPPVLWDPWPMTPNRTPPNAPKVAI